MKIKKLYFTDSGHDFEIDDFDDLQYFTFCKNVPNDVEDYDILHLYEVEIKRPLDLESVEEVANFVAENFYPEDYDIPEDEDVVDDVIEWFGNGFVTLDRWDHGVVVDGIIDEFNIDGLSDLPYYKYDSDKFDVDDKDGIMLFYPFGLIKSIKKIY